MDRIRVKFFIISILFSFLIAESEIGNIFFDIRVSSFKPAIENFSRVYPRNVFFPTSSFGVGTKNIFFHIRYETYSINGESDIDGADIKGKAKWEQTFLSAGIRAFTTEGIYVDMGYLLSNLKEEIGTYRNQYPALNRSFEAKQIPGFNFGVGFILPVNSMVRLSAEGNYKYVDIEKVEEDMKNIKPGGFGFSLGMILILK